MPSIDDVADFEEVSAAFTAMGFSSEDLQVSKLIQVSSEVSCHGATSLVVSSMRCRLSCDPTLSYSTYSLKPEPGPGPEPEPEPEP